MESETTNNENLVSLDVRPILALGEDPFLTIMDTVNKLKEFESLCVIVDFEPHPLYKVLEEKGFIHYAEFKDSCYRVYFVRKENSSLGNNNNHTALPNCNVIKK